MTAFRLFAGALLFLSVSACDQESDASEAEALTKHMCEKPLSERFPGAEMVEVMPEPLQPYEPACDSIQKLHGIRLENGGDLYLCRSFYPTEGLEFEDTGASAKQAAIQKHFGHPDAMDLLPMRLMAGYYFGVLLKVEEGVASAITTRKHLSITPITVETVEGAAAMAFLSGKLGEGYQPDALCAASFEATDSGWKITGADVFYNCQPRRIRTLTVLMNGGVMMLEDKEKTDENGHAIALCID
jgi:hypothetical protein